MHSYIKQCFDHLYQRHVRQAKLGEVCGSYNFFIDNVRHFFSEQVLMYEIGTNFPHIIKLYDVYSSSLDPNEPCYNKKYFIINHVVLSMYDKELEQLLRKEKIEKLLKKNTKPI